MNLINYFSPKQQIAYFDRQKTIFLIIVSFIGIIIILLSLIPELISPEENFFFSFFSKITALIVISISLIILKKRGVNVAGNFFSLSLVITLLFWMNILTEDISPIYKYIQGFYSVFTVLIVGVLFASRTVILINAVLIFITTTRVFVYAKTYSPENIDFFTTGYVSHTLALLLISVVLFYTNKFAIFAIRKAKAGELKFKQLSDFSYEGIFIHDNGVILDFNLASEKMFGYSRDEIIGKNAINLLIVKKYHKIIAQNIANNYTKPYEVEAIRKDGSIFPIEFEAKDVTIEDNKKSVRVSAVRDITQRKKAEKIIKKLSIAVEQSANAIVITDINGNIEYTNKQFSEITGYSAQELTGQNPRILNARTLPEMFYTEMWQAISSGETWKGKLHNKKKNGDYFWEYATITPLKDDNRETINYLGIKEDITDKIEYEKQIKEEKQLTNNAIETLPGIFFMYEIKKDGAKLIKWNKNHELFLGYTSEELQSMYMNDFFYNEQQKEIAEALAKVLKGTETEIEIESLIKHKKGHTLPYLFKSMGFKRNNKQYLLGVGLDISTLKKFEKELLDKNNELLASEEELAAANEELMATTDSLADSNNSLTIAKQKAVESHNLKTEFLNNISHEVRTPLNGIMGFSQLLNTPNLTEKEQQNYIDLIHSNGNQLLNIIDDIIEISKLGTNQVTVTENKIDLNELLLNLLSDFEIKANKKKIDLSISNKLSAKKHIILSDIAKLNKILSNLLDNAVKFTKNGSIEFGYHLIQTNSDSSLEEKLIQFVVKDTGIGINTDKEELIFKRFSQEDYEFSRNYTGLGLGLPIAMKNANLLGGTISLISEKENMQSGNPGGSTFYVTLPYKPAKANPE